MKDHVSIAAKTRIAAKAGVVRDIEEAGDYAGHPAMLAKEYKQQVLPSSSWSTTTDMAQWKYRIRLAQASVKQTVIKKIFFLKMSLCRNTAK